MARGERTDAERRGQALTSGHAFTRTLAHTSESRNHSTSLEDLSSSDLESAPSLEDIGQLPRMDSGEYSKATRFKQDPHAQVLPPATAFAAQPGQAGGLTVAAQQRGAATPAAQGTAAAAATAVPRPPLPGSNTPPGTASIPGHNTMQAAADLCTQPSSVPAPHNGFAGNAHPPPKKRVSGGTLPQPAPSPFQAACQRAPEPPPTHTTRCITLPPAPHAPPPPTNSTSGGTTPTPNHSLRDPPPLFLPPLSLSSHSSLRGEGGAGSLPPLSSVQSRPRLSKGWSGSVSGSLEDALLKAVQEASLDLMPSEPLNHNKGTPAITSSVSLPGGASVRASASGSLPIPRADSFAMLSAAYDAFGMPGTSTELPAGPPAGSALVGMDDPAEPRAAAGTSAAMRREPRQVTLTHLEPAGPLSSNESGGGGVLPEVPAKVTQVQTLLVEARRNAQQAAERALALPLATVPGGSQPGSPPGASVPPLPPPPMASLPAVAGRQTKGVNTALAAPGPLVLPPPPPLTGVPPSAQPRPPLPSPAVTNWAAGGGLPVMPMAAPVAPPPPPAAGSRLPPPADRQHGTRKSRWRGASEEPTQWVELVSTEDPEMAGGYGDGEYGASSGEGADGEDGEGQGAGDEEDVALDAFQLWVETVSVVEAARVPLPHEWANPPTVPKGGKPLQPPTARDLTAHLPEHERQDAMTRIRREKNRRAASKCRARKVQSLEQTEVRLIQLQEANKELKHQIGTLQHLFTKETQIRQAMQLALEAHWLSDAQTTDRLLSLLPPGVKSAQDMVEAIEKGNLDVDTLLNRLQNQQPDKGTSANPTRLAIAPPLPAPGTGLPLTSTQLLLPVAQRGAGSARKGALLPGAGAPPSAGGHSGVSTDKGSQRQDSEQDVLVTTSQAAAVGGMAVADAQRELAGLTATPDLPADPPPLPPAAPVKAQPPSPRPPPASKPPPHKKAKSHRDASALPDVKPSVRRPSNATPFAEPTVPAAVPLFERPVSQPPAPAAAQPQSAAAMPEQQPSQQPHTMPSVNLEAVLGMHPSMRLLSAPSMAAGGRLNSMDAWLVQWAMGGTDAASSMQQPYPPHANEHWPHTLHAPVLPPPPDLDVTGVGQASKPGGTTPAAMSNDVPPGQPAVMAAPAQGINAGQQAGSERRTSQTGTGAAGCTQPTPGEGSEEDVQQPGRLPPLPMHGGYAAAGFGAHGVGGYEVLPPGLWDHPAMAAWLVGQVAGPPHGAPGAPTAAGAATQTQQQSAGASQAAAVVNHSTVAIETTGVGVSAGNRPIGETPSFPSLSRLASFARLPSGELALWLMTPGYDPSISLDPAPPHHTTAPTALPPPAAVGSPPPHPVVRPLVSRACIASDTALPPPTQLTLDTVTFPLASSAPVGTPVPGWKGVPFELPGPGVFEPPAGVTQQRVGRSKSRRDPRSMSPLPTDSHTPSSTAAATTAPAAAAPGQLQQSPTAGTAAGSKRSRVDQAAADLPPAKLERRGHDTARAAGSEPPASRGAAAAHLPPLSLSSRDSSGSASQQVLQELLRQVSGQPTPASVSTDAAAGLPAPGAAAAPFPAAMQPPAPAPQSVRQLSPTAIARPSTMHLLPGTTTVSGSPTQLVPSMPAQMSSGGDADGDEVVAMAATMAAAVGLSAELGTQRGIQGISAEAMQAAAVAAAQAARGIIRNTRFMPGGVSNTTLTVTPPAAAVKPTTPYTVMPPGPAGAMALGGGSAPGTPTATTRRASNASGASGGGGSKKRKTTASGAKKPTTSPSVAVGGGSTGPKSPSRHKPVINAASVPPLSQSLVPLQPAQPPSKPTPQPYLQPQQQSQPLPRQQHMQYPLGSFPTAQTTTAAAIQQPGTAPPSTVLPPPAPLQLPDMGVPAQGAEPTLAQLFPGLLDDAPAPPPVAAPVQHASRGVHGSPPASAQPVYRGGARSKMRGPSAANQATATAATTSPCRYPPAPATVTAEYTAPPGSLATGGVAAEPTCKKRPHPGDAV